VIDHSHALPAQTKEEAREFMDPWLPEGATDPMDLPTADTLSLNKTIPLGRASSIPAIGESLGEYRLIRKLGSGGFGEVWEAEKLTSKRRLAVKVLAQTKSPSAESLERFKREGKLAASVNHPRCVFVFGAEEIDGLPVIAMELMSGGTLQDWLNQGGAMPSREAVDRILEVIEGLEAANQAGILHRDVKPSNCFVDEAGGCKIGDFGISKSLEASGGLTLTGVSLEAPGDLTQTGGFIGTLSYASPEQIRATELDVRSDIYSVGATLYALVTGKAPFEGKGAAVLAKILSGESTPISSYPVNVPKSLQRVILRAMSKDRDKRFASYSALCVALLPFSSHGLTPSSVLKRIFAYSIDYYGLLLIPFFAAYWPGSEASLTVRTSTFFLYFFLAEKYFGRTLGKYLFRLRVTSVAGNPITYRQALLRTGVWCLFLLGPEAIGQRFSSSAALGVLFVLSLTRFVTMRSRNGYAGLHEILSKTRVMMLQKGEKLSAQVRDLPRAAIDQSRGERRGPYVVQAVLWKNDSEALLAGYDEALGRRIWIHEFFGRSSRPMGSLIEVRPFRLRWLQGSRDATGSWDAYEAPRGIGFCEWVTMRRRLDWGEMRGVLVGVASEIEALLRDAPRDLVLSANQIWIHSTGTAKLFPFAAPQSNGAIAAGFGNFALSEWASFLHEITYFGLRGRLRPARHQEGAVPRVPLPEYARPLVERICQSTESQLGTTPRSHIEDLQRTFARPATVTALRRLGPSSVLVLPVALSLALSFTLSRLPMSKPWLDSVRDPAVLSIRRRLDPKLDEARKFAAQAYQELNATNEGRQLLSRLSPSELRELQEIAQLSELGNEEARRRIWEIRSPFPQLSKADVFIVAFLGFVCAIGSILMAAIFRAGPLFRLFKMSIQTRDGQRAGRLRCAARAAVAWMPFLVLGASTLFFLRSTVLLSPLIWSLTWSVSIMSLAVLALVLNLANPARGIPDWIAGTCVVPR